MLEGDIFPGLPGDMGFLRESRDLSHDRDGSGINKAIGPLLTLCHSSTVGGSVP